MSTFASSCRVMISTLLVLLMAFPAVAQTRGSAEGQLVRARDRFDYGDYADAVRILRRLIDEGRLTSEQQLVEAHRLLGVSLYYMNDHEESRAAFVRLLSIEPDFRLDPFFHPPRLVEFFDAVRADNEALLAPLRDQRRRLEEQRRLEEDARRRLLEEEERRRLIRQRELEPSGQDEMLLERVISNHTYAVNWLPFGAGQFQNQQQAKAIGLATAQIIMGSASILSYAVVASAPRCVEVDLPRGSSGEPLQTETRCGIPDESMNLVRNMERMKWMTGVAFWGLVVYGVVDAHRHYQPYKVISERRVSPPSAIEDAAESPSNGNDSDFDAANPTSGDQSVSMSNTPVSSSRPSYASGPTDKQVFPTPVKLTLSPWFSSSTAGAALTIRF